MKMGDIPGAARTGSSTTQSLIRGAALETDYLNGEICLLGRTYGIPTPVNDFLTDLAAKMMATGTSPGSMTLDDLRAAYSAWQG